MDWLWKTKGYMGFNIMFKVRTHESKSLRWWFINREDIDFSPAYQRKGNLWSPHDRSYLIDSIVNEFDIPKIYLADFTLVDSGLNSKHKSYAVIDGRQRLEAIFGFFQNEFSLADSFIYQKQPSLILSGLTYGDIQSRYPNISSIIDEFNLHVMSVITDDESMINDLFVRLNTSKALTGAEIRNAMKGPVANAIRSISGHVFFEKKINFQIKRGQDQNAAAKLLLLEFRGKLVDTKKYHLDRFVSEGVLSESYIIDLAKERVANNLDAMCEIFHDKDVLLSSQGVITIYYWFLREVGFEPGVRNFLSEFTALLKVNKERAKNDPTSADSRLLAYDLYGRSTNDQGSLVERFKILIDYYGRK